MGGIIIRKIVKVILKRLGTLKTYTIKDTWPELKKCDVLLLSHENDRTYNFHGKRYSQIIDSLRFYLEKNSVLCESLSLPFDSQKYSNNYYRDKTINRLFLRQLVLNFLQPLFFSKRFSSQEMHLRYIEIWLKVLYLCQPKVVIAIQPSQSLCAACHKIGIRVYDFQHGAIHDSMSTYGLDFNLHESVELKPTGYMCWNDVSADVLRRWCLINGLDVFVLGNPWFYRFKNKDKKDDVVQSAILQEQPLYLDKKSILVTLQWDLDHWFPEFYKPGEIIHSTLIDVINNPDNEVNWLLRLHPIQLKDKHLVRAIKNKFRKFNNVFIDWPTKMPLPEVISSVQGHITWSSSVVIEAAMFGIKNFVLNPEGFSISQLTEAQHKQTKYEYPFLFEEKMGLVERSIEKPNMNRIQKWIEGIPGKVTYENDLRNSFDVACLLDIVKGNV